MKAALAAALLIASSLAAAEDPLTFKGFALGAPRAEIVAVYWSLRCEGDRCSMFPSPSSCAPDTECYRLLNYGGVIPKWLSFTFDEDRLAMVHLTVPAERFDEVAQIMIERFGKPGSDEPAVIKNAMGATFDQRHIGWMRGDAILTATKRTGRIDESGVTLASKAFMQRQRDEKARKAKERAKEL